VVRPGTPLEEWLVAKVFVRVERQMTDQRINSREKGLVEWLVLSEESGHVRRQKAQKSFDYRVAIPPPRFLRGIGDHQHPSGRDHMGAHLAGELGMTSALSKRSPRELPVLACRPR
jgi:hypothetical protein